MSTGKESDYFVMILNIIAKKYNLRIYEAYRYLIEFEGIKFLQEFYDVEHTLNTDDVVDDILAICKNNGGTLQWTSIMAQILKLIQFN